MGHVGIQRAWAVTALCALLCGCTGTLVAIERAGCSTDRSVEVTRSEGNPERTTIKSRRVCGSVPPPEPEPAT